MFRMEVRFVKPSFGFMEDQTSKAFFAAKSDFLPSIYREQVDLPRRALIRRFLAFSECSELHLDIS